MIRKAFSRMILVTAAVSILAMGQGGYNAWSQDNAPVPSGAVQAQDVKAPGQAVQDNGNGNGNGGQQQEMGGSLYNTVKRGGPVMIPIILCGIIALTLVIERLIFFTRKRIWYIDQLEAFLREAAVKSKARYREEKADELREAFQQYLNQMERGMVFLQGIGNLAPLLGFLGTVTGMITAFAAIAAATTVNARIVAVGIQEALITTAGGLFVAAPATFFYYMFLHVIQQRFGQSDEIIDGLCAGLPRLSDELEGGEAVEEYK